MKLSAVLIVKNEKDHIETVLKSIEGVDEIIVCDTGSTDNTVELARAMGATVFEDYKWEDDFAAARNHALSHASGEWVLSIDGDEKLEVEGVSKIRRIVRDATDAQKTFSVNMWSKGQVHRLPRIFRNDGTVSWVGRGHETLSPIQENLVDVVIEYGHSTAHLLDPDRMMRILEKSVIENPTPRDKYYLAREYYYRRRYGDAIVMYQQYLKVSTWVPEKADGWLMLAYCYWYNFQGDDAREACLQAIGLNPDFKEALLLMAEMHYSPLKEKWQQFADCAQNTKVLFIRTP